MHQRNRPFLSIAAALALTAGSIAACTQADQENAVAETAEAGSELEEEAAQIGDALEAGAREVAQEVDQATDDLAAEADEQRVETAADDEGAPTGDERPN